MISIEHLVARSGVSGVARNENSRMYGCCNQGFCIVIRVLFSIMSSRWTGDH
jgi:hypothetical protein